MEFMETFGVQQSDDGGNTQTFRLDPKKASSSVPAKIAERIRR
jgi:hypothetical protein